MRVIGGIAGGRRLAAPKGDRVRPTADRVKEALFSILLSRYGTLQGLSVLDLFAGSGNLGIEALSRGAAHATFVDSHPLSIGAIRGNLALTCLSERAEMMPMDALKALHRLAGQNRVFDIIFIDPPYREHELMQSVLQILAGKRLTTTDGLIVFETGSKTILSLPEGFESVGKRLYGDTAIMLLAQLN